MVEQLKWEQPLRYGGPKPRREWSFYSQVKLNDNKATTRPIVGKSDKFYWILLNSLEIVWICDWCKNRTYFVAMIFNLVLRKRPVRYMLYTGCFKSIVTKENDIILLLVKIILIWKMFWKGLWRRFLAYKSWLFYENWFSF